MSYPPAPDYTSSGSHHSHPGYLTTVSERDQVNLYQTKAGVYNNNGRSMSYGSNAYAWPRETSEAGTSQPQNAYVNHSWGARQNTPNVNNYTPAQALPQEHTNVGAQNGTTRDNYSTQNIHGLNHLAYASGLESPMTSNNAVQRPRTQSRAGNTQHSPMSDAQTLQSRSTHASTGSVGNNIPCGNILQTHHLASIGRTSHNSPQIANRYNSSIATTTTMPNTVREGYPQTSMTSQPPERVQQSASPMTGPVHYPVQSSTQVTTPHSSNAQPLRFGQENTYTSSSFSQQNAQKVMTKNIAPQTTSNNQQAIVNIVNQPSASEQADERAQDSVHNPLPHYVNPSQVFNPYHREYERKRQEAAENDARKRAEDQKKAAENLASKSKEASTLANAQLKLKTMEESPVPVSEQPSTGTVSTAQTPTSSTQDGKTSEGTSGMATEMQKMILKMKEFRNTDPTLFTKLWNELRGATTATPGPVTVMSPPTQTVPPASAPSSAKTQASGRAGPPPRPANGIPLNGFNITVENNPEGLPDLGRFPAGRRIRTSYVKHKTISTITPTNSEPAVDQSAIPQPTPVQSAVAQSVTVQPAVAQTRPAEPAAIWPDTRRHAVAVAAVNLLKSYPVNTSINITPQDVSLILERNPSYLDLCTTLELKGLKFTRTTFARELLTNVPELQNGTTKTVAGGAANKEIAIIRSVAQTQSPPKSSSAIAVPQIHSASPQMVVASVESVIPKTSPTIAKQIIKTSKARIITSKEPAVGSKEAAARKRDFSELIDLTELNDDDNYILPTKQARVDPMPTLQQPTQQPPQQVEPPRQQNFGTMSAQPLRFNPQPQPYAYRPPEQYMPPPVLRSPWSQKPPGKILTKRLKRSEALQKSYYDPRTVARDILVTTGIHPTMPPLNAHLTSLLYDHIELESDMSTFDWDAIDPGGPPPPKVEWVDVPAAPPRISVGDRARKHAKRVRVEGARDIDQGRPTQDPSTSTVTSARSSAALQQQPASTPASNHKTRTPAPAAPAVFVTIPIHSHTPPSSATAPLQVPTSKRRMESDSTPSGKRRGRPPGAKNKHPSAAAMKKAGATMTVREIPVEDTPAENPPQLILSYKCKWVKCHAELHNLETLKRHLLKNHTPSDAEISANGFLCWWKRCPFLEADENGNMAPNHRFESKNDWIQHIDSEHLHPVAMKYGDGPRASLTGKHKPVKMDLAKYLYHPNVGPINRRLSHTDLQSVESARSRYLTDANGRATTPLIVADGNLDYPSDAMVLTRAYPTVPKTDREKADATAQNAFLKAHGNKGKDPRRAAEEVIRAMTVRKQKIGPGLDRGGCTLINDARRSTFIQAPDISRVVDLEY